MANKEAPSEMNVEKVPEESESLSSLGIKLSDEVFDERTTLDRINFLMSLHDGINRESTEAKGGTPRDTLITGDDLVKVVQASEISLDAESAETKILASLVPDEIIYDIEDYSIRNIEGALLFGDVSGFTELCEKYNKVDKGGSSRLTQILNSYIGAMVQEIMSHNGDILKFSGDAFVVVWKQTESVPMRDVVHAAIDCGLIIQKSYGSYDTDVDVTIRVKLIISCGTFQFSIIGDKSNSHYLEVGEPIWDIKAADGKSGPGDVVVTPNAWQHINTNEYVFNKVSDGQHIRVLSIGPIWRAVTKKNKEHIDEESEFALRPAVNYAVASRLKESMRRFIIKPIMDAIDLGESLDYLTEVRYVATIMLDIILTDVDRPGMVLKVANQIYKCVCSASHAYYGIVNKINFFDKDLMVLVIFGLRGYKMNNECERALKCATELRTQLMNIRLVRQVSIGVTTGITYCGVFGHVLRKEYTVISLMVNKAARLMMNYPNKVTCDRNVFISSHLNNECFILQEYKHLKGISNPGPIYEFVYVKSTHEVPKAVKYYPILGRDEELNIFKNLLDQAQARFIRKNTTTIVGHSYYMLIVTAERMLGKERLMSEFAYVVPADVPSVICNIIEEDKKIPYVTIRYIYLKALGLTEESTSEQIELILRRRLVNCPYKQFHCLNKIFPVHFPETKKDIEMNETEKLIFLFHMMKYLTYQVFVIFWVVHLRNIHNIDEQSWMLLQYLLRLRRFFVVASQHSEYSISLKSIHNDNIKRIHLSPLNNAYHGAMACQLMHVEAITPELERMLQSLSEGKPGWMENFLISLIQSSEIIVRNMTYKEAYDRGLQMPPTHMIKRISEWEKRKIIKGVMENDDNLEWHIYQDCYRESFTDLSDIEAFELKFKNERVITAATIGTFFSPESLDLETTMDVVMIKIFDLLTSYQQLVIKCTSILKSDIPRNMLVFIMNTGTKRKTAIAIKTLFEKEVLCCAHGNFLEANETMIFKGRLMSPLTVKQIKCECKGIIIDETCEDLPKYASCGYLRFRMSGFRSIIYNLLTDMQKKEFHNRAMKFLERESRRCKSCGGGIFPDILGEPKKNAWKPRKPQRRPRADVNRDIFMEYMEVEKETRRTSKTSMSVVGSSLSKHKPTRAANYNSLDNYSEKMSYNSSVSQGLIGIQNMKKLKKQEKLMKTFSNIDFSECQCHLILFSIFAELLEHCKGAENYDKMMEVMLTHANICIEYGSYYEAQSILKEAMNLLDNLAYSSKYLKWMLDIKRGKVLTLMGYAYFALNHYEKAYEFYQSALASYGCEFPWSNIEKKLKLFYGRLKHKIRFFMCRDGFKDKESVYAQFYDDVSECLYHFSVITSYMGKTDLSMLSAVWSLEKALQSSMNYVRLCNAYAQMIRMQSKFRICRFSIALETYALRMVHFIKYITMPEDIKATARLYASIFEARLCRSELTLAMETGYITWRLGNSKRSNVLLMKFLPLFALNAMYRNLINEAVVILQELEFFVNEERDLTGKLTFYTMCIITQLETCFTVESFRSVEDFIKTEGYIINIKDPRAKSRFAAVMWLWCIRNEYYETAEMWKDQAFQLVTNEQIFIKFDVICALYLLEGQILCLVHQLDRKGTEECFMLQKSIRKLINNLSIIKDKFVIIKPRLMHMKTYFTLALSNNYSCIGGILKAKDFSIKCGNLLERDFLDHTYKAWTESLPQGQIDFWKDHCEENLIDVHETGHIEGAPGFFTLPVPIYM